MTTVIKHCRVKKRDERKIDRLRIKQMIPGYEIPECPEHKVKSKIANIFANEKILPEYSVKIYKIDPYFCEHYKEKKQVDKNGCECVLFRIDVCFAECRLAVEIDEKNIMTEVLLLKRKDKKCYKKNLVVNLLELKR